ncbi:MAG: protein-L-isoaspartate(D-aspartate) O-methyltransferase, partial [Chloroflexota bacterium]
MSSFLSSFSSGVKALLYLWKELDFSADRSELIAELRLEISDERVLQAMAQVPRELFLPPEVRHQTYEDRPLPIGYGQTISQPYIIAVMTSALELTSQDKVLEVGTGSGYQAAILSLLAQKVITVERVLPLAVQAKSVLHFLGYKNVEVIMAEQGLGWPSQSPYDAIVVTAGAPRIPQLLLAQLKIGGRLVIPV